ncbi:MAG: polysaccharide deacetylase family protein [Planctomycetes bacterium]|nr:polysaccharide deacetylase family protein [Planctomycetota bacterium]
MAGYHKTNLLFTVIILVLLASTCSAATEPIYVMFTVDVESRSNGNPDRDIWGKIPDEQEDHGIGRMMDIFDRHGVKATFFVNVYEIPKSGEDAIAKVCRTINERGHDLELHTHPKPMFGVWGMSQADLDTQVRILKWGLETIKKWTGVRAIAHRAGGYVANLDTVKACKVTNIPLEFSYNMAARYCPLSKLNLTMNAPVVSDGVLCIPVTCYIQASVGSLRSMRFLDIESSSLQEIRKVIADLQAHDVRTAVIMMHSFSFSRFGKPNRRVENALDELVAGFVADPNVKVVTARQLYEIWRANPKALSGADYVPTTGWWMVYSRAWQRFGEGWKNIIVALSPPVFIVLVISASGFWLRRRRRKKKLAA